MKAHCFYLAFTAAELTVFYVMEPMGLFALGFDVMHAFVKRCAET